MAWFHLHVATATYTNFFMQTWTLKKAPETHALLAKLPEGVTIDGQKVVYMYNENEDIQEKDTIDPSEEKIAFIRKKRRRRSLRTKSTIRLEEPPKGNQVSDFERINLEGSIVDSSLEGMSATKYALLQVVKKNGSVDPSDMTINVILVGDTYHFKNIVATRVEKSLEELDNEYDKQLRLQKESNKRYHKISSALTKSDLNIEEDEASTSAFGSSSGRKKGTGSRKESGAIFRGHMNDAGQDVDEEKNFDDFHGVGLEYEEQVSDDDDDAELLQGVDAEREENDVDGGDIFEEEDDDSDSSSEAVDEEDEVDALDSKDKALQQASSELSDFLSNIKPPASSVSISEEKGIIVVDRGVKDELNGEAKEKRKESPTDLSEEEDKNKRRRVSSASSGTSLTEDLVRQTIIRMGGRVVAKSLAQELKKPIKKLGEAGKAKFREIFLKITESEDDAVFGKVWVLKK